MATIVLGLIYPTVCPSVSAFIRHTFSDAGDTAKSTGLIYFIFFNAKSFSVDNASLFHFFILSVMYVETDKKTDCGLSYFIIWPACHWAANFGGMQFNATFYHGNVKTLFNY